MRENRVKRILREGGLAIGTYVGSLADAQVVEIIGHAGYDPAFILRLLDLGVQGIQVPHVSGAAGARAAVQAVRYPPLGDRGIAGATAPPPPKSACSARCPSRSPTSASSSPDLSQTTQGPRTGPEDFRTPCHTYP